MPPFWNKSIEPVVRVASSYDNRNKPSWSAVIIEMESSYSFFSEDHLKKAHAMAQELSDVVQEMTSRLQNIVDKYEPIERER